MALLLGIYERLVGEVRAGAGALARLVRGDVSGFWDRLRRIDWLWLIALLAGILVAVVALASVLNTLIEDEPALMSAIFFGFVAASIVVAWSLLDRTDGTRLAVMAVVAVAAFVLLGIRSSAVDDPAPWVIVGAGALAICAMILPGISGSFILLMLGLYDHVIDAIDERRLGTVALFGVGAVIGLGSFSTFLNWLLKHHRDTVLAALIGLMAGSLRVLWPWPTGEEGLENVGLGSPVGSEVLPCLIGALVAAGVVLAVSRFASQAEAERQPASAG